jgi:hypothetical protein
MSTEDDEETEEKEAADYFKSRIQFHKEFIEAIKANWPKQVKDIENMSTKELKEKISIFPSSESSSSSDIDSDY